MEGRSVRHTLVAAATGVNQIWEVRREIESVAAVRFNFESQVQSICTVAQAAAKSSADQQIAERARQARLNESTAAMNKLGTAVTDLTARLAGARSVG
ncbi:hypothetical protein [Deinococcus altitudinis]|uniref:hypothetical protein n=1 Tax=Deinococcus altitudinis TaxID=468914 RepID=UPI003891220D